MITIEAKVTVTEDGELSVKAANLAPNLTPGEHEAVIVISAASTNNGTKPAADLPLHDIGPWPEGLSFRREDLYDD